MMAFDGGTMGSSAFAEALSRLKQRGSALLVVGNVAPEVHQLACRHFMGDPSMCRQRLFVTTDGFATDVQSSIVDRSQHENHVIDYVTNCRSTSERPDDDSTMVSYTTATSSTALISEIINTIKSIERDVEPLSPGELRVCIDSLSTVIESSNRDVPLRLVRYTALATRRRNGMMHVHLPVARDSELASLFEPLVDAVVELRVADGTPQQRWHLTDAAIPSDWTNLNE